MPDTYEIDLLPSFLFLIFVLLPIGLFIEHFDRVNTWILSLSQTDILNVTLGSLIGFSLSGFFRKFKIVRREKSLAVSS